jgi:hypothetical protein
MKAYKVELLIVDYDNCGDSIKDIIENQKFPNYCISPSVISMISADIGEWTDEHPLNYHSTSLEEKLKYFVN